MTATPQTPQKIDLATCDREPIHIPGAVQAHGFLLQLDHDLGVLKASANVRAFLGVGFDEVVGRDLLTFLDHENGLELAAKLKSENLARHNPLKVRFREEFGGTTFDGAAHGNGSILLECEPAQHEFLFPSFYHYSREAVARLRASATTDDLYQNAVDVVREITGFDRVLIYSFDEIWNGHVLAENKADKTSSYLDLHFPASDIPRQARDLYYLNRLRLIPNVNYVPAILEPVGGEPVDLSFSVLRGVSPVHIEYLRNMGATASMSISLIKDEKLWGLISCTHESGPLYVPQEARAVCDFVGEIMSSLLSLRESGEAAGERERSTLLHTQILHEMTSSDRFIDGLIADHAALLGLVGATGAAVYFDDKFHVIGRAPADEHVREIVDMLSERSEDLFATASLSSLLPSAAAYKDVASGLLAFSISKAKSNYVMWFRPEVVQTVKWGGNPNKPVEFLNGVPTLHPRKSFAAWKQTVTDRALPWREVEKNAAMALRTAIIDIVLQRVEKISRLNLELERSNSELDSFAYAASHDLKEPLRGISNYASLLLRNHAPAVAGEVGSKLETITRLSKRMENLINSLLHFSQVGRTDLTLRETDLNEVVHTTIESLRTRIDESRADIKVQADLPTVIGDRVQLMEVFTNLMSNAIKYNTSRPPRVEVGLASERDGDRQVIYVKDNGIGIDPVHRESVFKIFKRLHGKDQYGGGTGTGLTITKKIVERHSGRIWMESVPDAGTTFFFSLAPVETHAQ